MIQPDTQIGIYFHFTSKWKKTNYVAMAFSSINLQHLLHSIISNAFSFKPDLFSPPFVDRLNQKDALVVHALTEKLQLFAEMAETTVGLEDTASRSRLLLRGDASDLQQGEALLKGAITEGRGGTLTHCHIRRRNVLFTSRSTLTQELPGIVQLLGVWVLGLSTLNKWTGTLL